MPKRIKINKGDKYCKLTIIKEVKQISQFRYFECKCECGNIKNILLGHLRSGNTKSCGCFMKEKNTTHGMNGCRIYRIWANIKERCNNIKNTNYKYYGARGITYDKKWETFEGFYKDMKDGYKENLTIDREDNNGNYKKSNCRWATIKEQNRNRRNNIMYKGKMSYGMV